MTEALKELVNRWLQKAANDLRSADRLINSDPPLTDTACFHCQQSIEKDLKAYLAYNEEDIQRTHNIVFLLSKCAAFDPVFGDVDPGDIDRYAVEVRYAEFEEMPSLEDTQALYGLAEKVKALVKDRIIF